MASGPCRVPATHPRLHRMLLCSGLLGNARGTGVGDEDEGGKERTRTEDGVRLVPLCCRGGSAWMYCIRQMRRGLVLPARAVTGTHCAHFEVGGQGQRRTVIERAGADVELELAVGWSLRRAEI
jgi:hypothetical protein